MQILDNMQTLFQVINLTTSMHRQHFVGLDQTMGSALAPGDGVEAILSEPNLCCLCSLAPTVISYC